MVAASTISTSSASAAAGTGSVLSPAGVLYASGCYQHPYTYALQLPAGTRTWDLDVDFFLPDGTPGSSDSVSSYSDSTKPTTGAGDVQICSIEMAGTWTVAAELEVCDTNYACTTTTLPPTSFVMRPPESRTTLSVSTKRPRVGQAIRFKVTSTDERPNGYFPTSSTAVRLERRISGKKWKRIKDADGSTGESGSTGFKPSKLGVKKVLVRAVTVGDGEIAPSLSNTVAVYPKQR